VRHTLKITRRLKPGGLFCIGMNSKRKNKRGELEFAASIESWVLKKPRRNWQVEGPFGSVLI
jgi:hypothetical protein